ncbi:MAG: hypothetical protein JWP66_215 [Naasia sp.]|nr:hypothetical protein [Naasia sp.]
MSRRFTLSTPVPAAERDQSFWLRDTAALARRFPALAGDVHADVAIIGGGLTGLWSAIRLRETSPELRVVVVEAVECGYGASGRNGGQVHSWFESLDRLADATDEAEAFRLAQATSDAMDELQALQDSGELDMGLRLDGWLWTASSIAQEGAWDGALERTAARGVAPYQPVDAAELQRRTGSTASYTGVLERKAGTLHPGKLMRNLAIYAATKGVEIFERSPVTELTAGSPATLRTASGSVTAGKVLLATNIWASAIPQLRRKMFIVDSEVIATEQIPERLEAFGWTDGASVCDAQDQVLYYQRTEDGRIVFGRGSGRTTFRDRIGAAFNRRRDGGMADTIAEFHRVYPQLRDVRIDYDWTGGIDCVPAHVPIFGNLAGASNVFYALGWNGTALAQIPATSRIIASMILGRTDEWGRSKLINQRRAKSLPPEPFRFVGAIIVRQAIVWKNRAEIVNRRPNPVLRAVLTLMPKGTREHE